MSYLVLLPSLISMLAAAMGHNESFTGVITSNNDHHQTNNCSALTTSLCNLTDSSSTDRHRSKGHGHQGEGGLHVAALAYEEIRDPLIFTIVVLLAGISKIGKV